MDIEDGDDDDGSDSGDDGDGDGNGEGHGSTHHSVRIDASFWNLKTSSSEAHYIRTAKMSKFWIALGPMKNNVAVTDTERFMDLLFAYV